MSYVPMMSNEDLSTLSGVGITHSEVLAIRWLGCMSSRIPSIEQMVDWELSNTPEVAGEFFPITGHSVIAVRPGSYGLLIDQRWTQLRKAFFNDCSSELTDDWYEYEDAPLATPRLMPDGLEYEDEGFGIEYWPGWAMAKAVYDEIPLEKRVAGMCHTEGFFTKPSYCGVVIITNLDGSVPKLHENDERVLKMFTDRGLPSFGVPLPEPYKDLMNEDV